MTRRTSRNTIRKPGQSVLSGNAYVPARIDDEWTRLIVGGPRCRHVHTVCATCVESWARDYDIYLHRTNGGRRVAELAGIDLAALDHRPYVSPRRMSHLPA